MERITIYTITLLWIIAIGVTYFMLEDTGYFQKLSPVYIICMAGSVSILKYSFRKILQKEKED